MRFAWPNLADDPGAVRRVDTRVLWCFGVGLAVPGWVRSTRGAELATNLRGKNASQRFFQSGSSAIVIVNP